MHERDAILQLWHDTKQAALATVVEVKGSAYRRPGARMLLCADGRSAGVINGGCLDGDLRARAQMVMESGVPQLACYDTTSPQDIVFGLGLGCRGVVRILIEPVENLDWFTFGQGVEVTFEGEVPGTRAVEVPQSRPGVFAQTIEAPQPLYIFGAGVDVVPLRDMGCLLGWEVRVIDLRAPSPERVLPVEATHISLDALPSALDLQPEAACVVMTHNFLHDLELLKVLLPSAARYLGILGPRRRTDELLEKLGNETLFPPLFPDESQLARLHAPIGLDVGAETPEEIALSIVAEIQKVRREKSGASLRELKRIH